MGVSRMGQTIIVATLMLFLGQSAIVLSISDSPTDGESFLPELDISFTGSSDVPFLIKDINAGSTVDASPNYLHKYDNQLFFEGYSAADGFELWKSNGTTNGTVMVKDINPSGSSFPEHFVNMNGSLYFVADDGTHGYELWKSDGTASGTIMVKDINAGSVSGSISVPIAVGNTLFFKASDGTNGGELWKSDGTASGTVMVKDINSGGNGVIAFDGMVEFQGSVYFSGDDGTHGYELWKSDGTANGTVMVKDIYNSTINNNGRADPESLTVVGNTLYFCARDSTHNDELWKTDGTTNGTVMVKDINPGIGSGMHMATIGTERGLTVVNNTLYFEADDGTHGRELWKSDGSEAGTVMVKDIYNGTIGGSPRNAIVMGNALYFNANGGTHGKELWKSDGSEAGTVLVKDINPNGSHGDPTLRANGVFASVFYFSAEDGIHGRELWKSDGSESGTVMVADINNGSASCGFSRCIMSSLGDTLIFFADDGVIGNEMWGLLNASGGGISLSPASTTVSLTNNTAMTPITYNWTGGSGSVTTTYNGNGTAWFVTAEFTSGWSNGRALTAMGTRLYIVADDGNTGLELWAHETTNDSTWQVADINSGAGNGFGSTSAFFYITVMGTRLYFSADDGSSGYELWAHETTNDSTWQVADINSGSGDGNADHITAMGTRLYFRADDGSSGKELWAHESTNDSTWQVADINSGSGNGMEYTREMTAMGTRLYFNADDGSSGRELWAHETTNDSTWLVADIDSGSQSGYPTRITVMGTRLYFSASGGWYSAELYAHETTNDSTWQVKDIYNGSGSSMIQDITVMGTRIYFEATDGISGYELWAHESANGSTWLASDTYSGSSNGWANDLMALGTRLYFQSSDGSSGYELYAHETTNDSTWLVADILSGSSGSWPGHFTAMGTRLYFRASEGSGYELWAYDPANLTITSSGPSNGPVTSATCEISPSLPTGISIAQGTCTISGTPTTTQSSTVYTLWVNDSGVSDTATIDITIESGLPIISPASTTVSLTNNTAMAPITFNFSWIGTGAQIPPDEPAMIKDINSGGDSSPLYLTVVGSTLYFVANDETNGSELWKSDGTASGTVMVKDIHPSSGASINLLTAVGTTLYFEANDGTNGSELWKSDGTVNGTVMVKDINSGGGSSLNHLTAVGNTLFFKANDGTNGNELWKSDGTASGTVMVKDIRSGSSSSSPEHLTAVGNTLFFKANDGTNGAELWKSDGTAFGTVMVKDIFSGVGGSSTDHLTAVGNTLYFQANDGPNGKELWESDGTANGTVMVKDIHTSSNSLPEHLTAVGNTLFFKATDGTNGAELWKSDGTVNGTVMVKDIRPGSSSSFPLHFTAVGNTLYLQAKEGTHGIELWMSDGTENGTVMVKDIYSGNSNSLPNSLIAVDNTLYFKATDGTNGAELWKSDGTVNGTVMVKDIYSGSSGSTLNHLTAVGNTLYFQADDGTNGVELWGVQNASIGTSAPTWSIHPNLPTGLSFDSSNGTITGTPTATQVATTYTIWANESVVSAMATVNITIDEFVPDPPSISPALTSVVLTNTTAMSPIEFTNSGGVIDTWEVYPSMPSGLTFDASNGTISGTPTIVQTAADYTVWANNTGGQSNATVNITIDEFVPDPPSISPALTSVVLTNTTAMSPIEFTNSGGVIDTWEVYPSLPSGLTFDASNGTISGTPTTVQTAADYTVWANNTGGQSSATVNITIGELPPEFSYNESAINLTRLVSMDYLVPSVTGGPVETWEIEPVLPEGLEFSYGEISGIPLVNMTETTFTVWANNSGGSDSNTFTIIIVEPPEGLIASQTFALLVRDVAMYNILVNYIGGDIDTWEIEPPLPLGLTFDTENNVISGTPVDVMAETNYTIWANSSTISDSLIITLKVLEDTDGDGDPDDLEGVTWPALDEDLDDDADGISDVAEGNANPITDSLLPDTDGDGVCDGSVNVTIRGVDICTGGPDHFPDDPAADTDTDGDGDPDIVRDGFDTNLTEDLDDDNDGLPDENETTDFSITDSLLPDTDGDGVCDGSINVTIRGEEICTGGPDAFPNDPAADTDTDGDGKPDELHGNSTTGLIEDLDDDGDQASDIAEIENGTDPKDPLDFPTDDADGDGWTDAQEDFCGTDKFDNSSVPSDYDEDKWCDIDDPDDDNDGWSDDNEDACGTNPLDETSVPKDDDGNGICNSLEDSVPESDDDSIFPWWLCALFLLALILILPIILGMKGDEELENFPAEHEEE